MPMIEMPKKGDPITAEWACAIVAAINDLAKGPEVVAPLARSDGHIYFADNYLLRSVKTTSIITARSGTTMGTGTCDFYQATGSSTPRRTLTACGGYKSINVVSKLGNAVPTGVYGVVAWIDDQFELISADCSGNA